MKYLLLSLLVFSSALFAETCNTQNGPLCPGTGVRILDDTYPIHSFVISQDSFASTRIGQELPRKTMIEVMRAYGFNPAAVPNIIYPAGTDDYNHLKSKLIEELRSQGVSTENATALVNSRVRHVETTPYTWQQDYFEATFDSQSGSPKIHYSQVYEQRDQQEGLESRASFRAIAASGICGTTEGAELQTGLPSARDMFLNPNANARMEADTKALGTRPTGNAEFGGNMEGLPGGLCLVGNNMTERFATQVCGPSSNIVRAEVNWLAVGHVDEVFKVVPDRRNIEGRPPECAFTIFSADTELGLSLLRNNPGQSTLIRRTDSEMLANGYSGITSEPSFYRSFVNPPAMRILCPIVNKENPSVPSPDADGGAVEEAMLNLLFISRAYAADDPAMSESERRGLRCARNFGDVKNHSFVEAIDSLPDLLKYNKLIQEALVRSRQNIYNAVLARLPQCQPFFRTMDDMFTKVPNYFSPDIPQRAGARMPRGKLLSPGANANSFFPNPTNGVMANKTLLFPGPVPEAYRSYLNGVTRNLGLTPTHLDTWDYAHTGSGNLHCSSHSLPYCRPNGGSR